MAASGAQTGHCLCGKVTFTIETPVHDAGACHCSMCLRWGGGPLFALHNKGKISFQGEEHIVRYRSSEWAERGFCGVCGTHLFYHLVPTGEHVVSAGALDDISQITLTSQIFIDEKPGWYALANKTVEMTGEEVFAEFAASNPQDM